MDRRGFLKRAGAAALTVMAAPLSIPSERLDVGVPRQKIVLPETETGDWIRGEGRRYVAAPGDDTLSIQGLIDAVAASGGGTIRMPTGTYRVSRPIEMRSGITIPDLSLITTAPVGWPA